MQTWIWTAKNSALCLCQTLPLGQQEWIVESEVVKGVGRNVVLTMSGGANKTDIDEM